MEDISEKIHKTESTPIRVGIDMEVLNASKIGSEGLTDSFGLGPGVRGVFLATPSLKPFMPYWDEENTTTQNGSTIADPKYKIWKPKVIALNREVTINNPDVEVEVGKTYYCCIRGSANGSAITYSADIVGAANQPSRYVDSVTGGTYSYSYVVPLFKIFDDDHVELYHVGAIILGLNAITDTDTTYSGDEMSVSQDRGDGTGGASGNLFGRIFYLKGFGMIGTGAGNDQPYGTYDEALSQNLQVNGDETEFAVLCRDGNTSELGGNSLVYRKLKIVGSDNESNNKQQITNIRNTLTGKEKTLTAGERRFSIMAGQNLELKAGNGIKITATAAGVITISLADEEEEDPSSDSSDNCKHPGKEGVPAEDDDNSSGGGSGDDWGGEGDAAAGGVAADDGQIDIGAGCNCDQNSGVSTGD